MPLSQAIPFDDDLPANVAPGTAAAGTAAEASRGDHVHNVNWSGVAPTDSAPGDVAGTGSANGLARRDHLHGREAATAAASQVEMETGTEAAIRTMSPLRVAQAIDALAAGGGAHAASHQNGGADEITIAGLDGTPVELTNHLADATDAHDASAISFDDTGLTITAADVQTMGEQLDAAISAGGIPGTIGDAKGDSITFSAADTPVREAVGADGTVLMAASGETTGRKWFAYGEITEATLGGDVTMVTGDTFYDGPTITPAAGTYDVWARVAVQAITTAQQYIVGRLIANASATPIDEVQEQTAMVNTSVALLVMSARVVADGTNPILVRATGSNPNMIMKRDPANNSSDIHRATLLVITRVA